MEVLLFEDFVLEEDNQQKKKINFLLAGEKVEGLTGKNNKRIYGEINDKCLDELFNTYYAVGDKDKDLNVDNTLPLIYYGGNKPEALNFLKKYNYTEENMYNTPDQMKLSGNKSTFYKMFSDLKYIPKTAYDVKAAAKLQVPIIAKPDSEHSGLGIEIFQTYNDLKISKNEFDNFAEAKDIKNEFRVLLMKDEIILISERISNSGNEIADKDINEQTEFVYVEQDLNKVDFIDELTIIIKEIRSKIKLGVWSIDILLDTSNKLWVIEINSASGMATDKMTKTYISVFNDFYPENISRSLQDLLHETYIKPIYNICKKLFNKQIKNSIWPISELVINI